LRPSNVAVTVRADDTDTVQAFVFDETDVHPDHDESFEPGAADAVSVTAVGGVVFGTATVHVPVWPVPHDRPPPETVPFPVPSTWTASGKVAGSNVAETARADDIGTVHVVPAGDGQADQPVNFEDAPGTAVSVTTVPDGNPAAHVAPHAIPAGAEVTVPDPAPSRVTVRA
jgi:hypothetical protein